MKTLARFLTLFSIFTIAVFAQEDVFQRTQLVTPLARPISSQRSTPSSQIKSIQTVDGRWGFASTSDALYRTHDGGATWDELRLDVAPDELISIVSFMDVSTGYAVLSTTKDNGPILLRTRDGGGSWERNAIQLPNLQELEADLSSVELKADAASLELSFRLTTSSNFSGTARYVSDDDGATWRFAGKQIELRRSGEEGEMRSRNWIVTSEGSCAGFKTGCVLETRLLASGIDITPAKIAELSRAEKEKGRIEAIPMFALPPGGSTRISLNRGFDKCQAGTIAQMQLWWDNSPHYDSNIYMSGRNRACPTQPFSSNPAWIDQVSAQGWGLIPTVVGYQSPCTSSATTAKLSYDVAVAEQQGRGEADIAVADANSIGLTTGSILYYDMERYDPPNPDTLRCRAATVAFLKGWTDRI
ncbi:MAG TPA: glycoside hydrolase domain-containing protein, partial [Pyrinomonadaceae bacterium]|nr:glycoside hydrolase domain-containing protein [Pyrinomonadaceae bacterium]